MKPYIQPVSPFWWLKRRPYFLFIIRELTALFVGYFSIFLLVLVSKLSSGKEAYEGLISLLHSPAMIMLHIIALAFAVYHSITWLNLTPKAMVVRIGEEKIPDFIMIGQGYAGWAVVSGIVTWLILKF